jgi:hypothetical protein
MRTTTIMAVAALFALALGCGDDDDASGADSGIDGGADGDTDTDADSDSDDGLITLAGYWRSNEFVEDECGTILEGAEVCWHGAGDPQCTETDENSDFAIDGVAQNEFGYMSVRDVDGAYDIWMPFTTGTEDMLGLYMCLDYRWTYEGWYEDVGLEMDPGTGVIAFEWGPAGATIAMDPASGEGPYYTKHGDRYTIDLDAGTCTGSRTGVFLDVEPGEYTLSMDKEGQICDELQPAGELPVTVELRADSTTWIIVNCNPVED